MFFSEDVVRERLRDVVDPEMRLSVVDLGLIYGIEIDGANGARHLHADKPGLSSWRRSSPSRSGAAVLDVPGVREVELSLTFSPPWDPRTMASEDARMELGIW